MGTAVPLDMVLPGLAEDLRPADVESGIGLHGRPLSFTNPRFGEPRGSVRASCSCAAAEPCDASEPSHDCTSPSPPTARGHPRAGSSRRERPPSRRGPTVPRPVSSGTQKTPRVLSHLGAMPCSGSRAILHAATSRPNARPPRRGCSAACGPATSPERPGVGAAARAAPGARGTGTSPGSSGGGRGRRTSSHQTCSPSGSSSASEPEGHDAAVWRREPTSPPPLCSPRPGRVQTRRPPPMDGHLRRRRSRNARRRKARGARAVRRRRTRTCSGAEGADRAPRRPDVGEPAEALICCRCLGGVIVF